jgi:hypothetical protein
MAFLPLRDPIGRVGEDVVEDAEHLLVGLDLLLPGWVILVLLLLWYLVEHLGEEEVEAGVGFDGVLETFQCWMKFLVLVFFGLGHELA